MASRLDRLFILLETGTNSVTKRAAAQQLGEAQRLHPHELHHLLARVSTLLKSARWDTRVAAADAVQAILAQLPQWTPEPRGSEQPKIKEEPSDTKNYLSLEDFDMEMVLSRSRHLTGSEGKEYDLALSEGEQQNSGNQSEKMLASKLGLDSRLMDTRDLFTEEDLRLPPGVPNQGLASECAESTKISEKKSIAETLGRPMLSGLSWREINQARRKARKSLSKQRSSDDINQQESQNAGVRMPNAESLKKKIKLEDRISPSGESSSSQQSKNSGDNSVTTTTGIVPDGTGCWPEAAIDWPLESFSESLCQDLFDQKWEVRHGAATALRELVRLHGKGAGKSRDQTKEEMEASHRSWLVDAALRLLCVLGLDRFGDYVSDQVVAPVRETCAQALGSLVLLMQNGDEKNGVLGILDVTLKLLKNDEWEARHGAFLALKYLLAVRDDLLDECLPRAFPAAMLGLADPVDDVGAAAASALIPVASALPRVLVPEQLQAIIVKLWELLREQDDLAAACNSFMGLLAAIISLPEARACLTPQPLSLVLPRLWRFLGHSSSSVRKAALGTLHTLTGEDVSENPRERWGFEGSAVLQEALRRVFQRVLIEHVEPIQLVAEQVWHNLVVRSDLEMLLHAACPLVSTWLCLAMQPEQVPFNPGLLSTGVPISTTTSPGPKVQNRTPPQSNGGNSEPMAESTINGPQKAAGSSELKFYIGGIETIGQNVRRANAIRARCMAARMLGLLSRYIVKPAPGVVYTPDIPSPALCYARVLLAHLASRSALQRTVVGLTMAHWAALEDIPPDIPDILSDKLLGCLNECVYYDEIAGAFTRLLHESCDYAATLKHYKLASPVDAENSTIMTLEQISNLAEKPVTVLQLKAAGIGNHVPATSVNNSVMKLKPKLIQSLDDRREALKATAASIAAQQQTLNVMAMAALAASATMFRCLPEPPQPLNPLVKPLMEAIKREENEDLQKLAANHLALLVDLCADRNPSPNTKITTNLCTFLCSDLEFTPRYNIETETEPYEGILTLKNRQRQAERIAYNRGAGSGGPGGTRGPGRPPATDIPLEELLACDEPEAKASRTRRRGASYALTALARLIGSRLPERLPHLWERMIIEDTISPEEGEERIEEHVNKLVFRLQVLEIVGPSVEKSLFGNLLDSLPQLCSLLAHPYKCVRHMASRCLSTLADLDVEKTMKHIVQSVIPLLEPKNGDFENSTDVETSPKELNTPLELDIRRQGAAEALTCIVENLGVRIVPYAVLFMIPILGRMSDQNTAVRLACSATLATLVQLLPLDPGSVADSPHLNDEKMEKRRFLEQLLNPRSIPDTKIPVSVAAELRSYQQQGLNWLHFLNKYQLHGILCDDMGLGKTLQTLCILAVDHHHRPKAPPSLVICPTTLTGHWVSEAEKFFQKKDLSVIQFAGTPLERERLRALTASCGLVVTNYDIVRKDIEFFETVQWNYCVLDEGHVIKNGKTKSAKAVKRLRAHHRLILSGTPVQNDVLELWSLFDFLMPGFLGTEKQFAAKYSRRILACRDPKAGQKEQEAGALAMESLHRQVLPFLLRRMKEDVLKDLPAKITQDYYCDLSPIQRILYEDFRTRHSATLIGNTNTSNSPTATATSANSKNSPRAHVFEALRYLRNVCNHPKLVLSPRHPQYQTICAQIKQQKTTLTDIEIAAKLPALKQLLLDCGIGQPQQQISALPARKNLPGTASPMLVDPGQSNPAQQQLVSQHRALIFCQVKAMLDIVEKDLLGVHLPTVTYLRLDGGVPAGQRHSIVSRFNADPSIDVLLLTTQVGGLGLNLTGADTVIFVEHDWNPMKDLQAMDRAHRIGQKKVVNVYRLITRSTVEEKIMGLQRFKMHTANTVISGENSCLQTMGTDKLLDLFSLDNGKEAKAGGSQHQNDCGSQSMMGVPGGKSVLEIFPELWEQQQYDDEYDLDSFLGILKSGDNQ